jgi:hypothetical protein
LKVSRFGPHDNVAAEREGTSAEQPGCGAGRAVAVDAHHVRRAARPLRQPVALGGRQRFGRRVCSDPDQRSNERIVIGQAASRRAQRDRQRWPVGPRGAMRYAFGFSLERRAACRRWCRGL